MQTYAAIAVLQLSTNPTTAAAACDTKLTVTVIVSVATRPLIHTRNLSTLNIVKGSAPHF